jgi:hypothetical protein
MNLPWITTLISPLGFKLTFWGENRNTIQFLICNVNTIIWAMGNRSRASELSVIDTITAELMVPTVIDIADADSNSKPMHRTTIDYVDTAIGRNRRVHRNMKPTTPDISTKSDRVQVLDVFL